MSVQYLQTTPQSFALSWKVSRSLMSMILQTDSNQYNVVLA